MIRKFFSQLLLMQPVLVGWEIFSFVPAQLEQIDKSLDVSSFALRMYNVGEAVARPGNMTYELQSIRPA